MTRLTRINRLLGHQSLCEYFVLEELVHPAIVKWYGQEAWQLLDTRMLIVLDYLRANLGKIIINNYLWGGDYTNSGLRLDYGGSGSAHRFGCGYDIKAADHSPEEVHAFIQEHQQHLFILGLRRVEHLSATPTWTHLDGKPAPDSVPPGVIHFFKP